QRLRKPVGNANTLTSHQEAPAGLARRGFGIGSSLVRAAYEPYPMHRLSYESWLPSTRFPAWRGAKLPLSDDGGGRARTFGPTTCGSCCRTFAQVDRGAGRDGVAQGPSPPVRL